MVTYLDRIKCNECSNTIGNHKWAKIKACADGWLLMHSGDAYCPSHLPIWAAWWREKRGSNARADSQ